MAGSNGDVPLWDRNHKNALRLISVSQAVYKNLTKNIQSIFDLLDMSNSFWEKLMEREVLTKDVKQSILVNPSKLGQASLLVAHLSGCHVYQYYGFIWALVNSGQYKLVQKLSLDSAEFLDAEALMKQSSFLCPACLDPYTKAFVFNSCGHYVCGPCAKGANFTVKDNNMEEITCPVPTCRKTIEVKKSVESIGLEEDKAFADLCNAVHARVKALEYCSVCKVGLPLSSVKHTCKDCKSTLCYKCFMIHKRTATLKEHEIVHQHFTRRCCCHGNETLKHCFECGRYLCGKCNVGACKHHKDSLIMTDEHDRVDYVEETDDDDYDDDDDDDDEDDDCKTEERKDEEKEVKKEDMDKYDRMMQSNGQKMESLLETQISHVKTMTKFKHVLEKREDLIKDHLEKQEEKLINWAKEWRKRQLGFLNDVHLQIDTTLSRSVQWQRATRELITLLKGMPCFMDSSIEEKFDEAPRPLPKEVGDFLEQLQSKTSLLKHTASGQLQSVILPKRLRLPYFMNIAPHTATSKNEWRAPGHKSINQVTVSTDSPRVLVSVKNHVWELELDETASNISQQCLCKGKDYVYIYCGKSGFWAGALHKEIDLYIVGNPNPRILKLLAEPKEADIVAFYIKDNLMYVMSSMNEELYVYANIRNKGVKLMSRMCILESESDENNDSDIDEDGDDDSGDDYDGFDWIHITDDNKVIGTCGEDNTLHIVDLNTEEKIVVGEEGKGPGQFSDPSGIFVTESEHILVCDTENNRICVYTMLGGYMHDIEFDKPVTNPTTLGIIANSGKQQILVVGSSDVVRFYILE